MKKYDGRMVALSGVLRGGPDQDWIVAANCSTKIEVKGHKFANLINPTDPSGPVLVHRPNFQQDAASIQELRQARRGLDRKTQQIRAIFIGLFGTRANLDDLVSGRGDRSTVTGFGHLGAAPAQLIIERIEKITIEPIEQ